MTLALEIACNFTSSVQLRELNKKVRPNKRLKYDCTSVEDSVQPQFSVIVETVTWLKSVLEGHKHAI